MNFIFFAFFSLYLSANEFDFTKSPYPALSNVHQHLVFEFFEINESSQLVKVSSRLNNRVPGHSKNYIVVTPYGKPNLEFEISKEQFLLERKLAPAVFQAITGTGTARGTAFLIRKNKVLTNKHVLANNHECRKFAVILNHKKETVTCKEVLYCSPEHDFCLIEMNAMRNGHDIGEEVKPLELSNRHLYQNESAMIIGNAYGVGIHAASFLGVFDRGSDWVHLCRVFSGNSGSPIMDNKGKVIGIHYGRGGIVTSDMPEDRIPGRAVKSETIINETLPFLYQD